MFKFGETIEPSGRLCTYLTGCPPGLTPSSDLQYYGIWSIKKGEDPRRCEEAVHNTFRRHRMITYNRKSEWFDFKTDEESVVKGMTRYMAEQSWVQEKEDHVHWNTRPPQSRYFQKYYHTNHQCIRREDVRSTKLNEFQEGVIYKQREFLLDDTLFAGYVIAPCGSGKTHMTSKSMKGNIKRVLITCPGNQIQGQWMETLIRDNTFIDENIMLVGTGTEKKRGTTDPAHIQNFLELHDTACVIATYASSHLMIPFLHHFQLLVMDEAHHMAGVVRDENSDQGRTRMLLHTAVEMGIKRMSLTYTPRYVITRDEDQNILSMDDDKVFGKEIARLSFREMVRAGVLPDYRLWLLRDKEHRGQGIKAKAECVMEAWRATEETEEQERFICNKLIIYCPNWEEATQVEEVIRTSVGDDTVVFIVKGGNKTASDILDQFTDAKRAILINCFVLGEGVDVPCADSVAILYSKKARGQITQMILRPGRWYKYDDGRVKSVFHVLLPAIDDEDMSGFEEVLCTLASNDDRIRDEVVLQSHDSNGAIVPRDPFSGAEEDPQCVMIEEADAKEEEIRRCFGAVRQRIFSTKDYKRIQSYCIEKGIDTSTEYNHLRADLSELPEDPRPKGVEWYDYLHPTRRDRITASEFVKTILDPNMLRMSEAYDMWRGVQPIDILSKLPSVQHILDGFFGKDDKNFISIREKYGKKATGRGR